MFLKGGRSGSPTVYLSIINAGYKEISRELIYVWLQHFWIVRTGKGPGNVAS
jgi:hypothetical protein